MPKAKKKAVAKKSVARKPKKKAAKRTVKKAAKRTVKKAAKRSVKKAAGRSARSTARPAARRSARSAAKPAARRTAKTARGTGARKTAASRSRKKVLATPRGYNTITPYLIVNNAKHAIDFYKKIFGAKEKMRMEKHDGKIGHAELQIGDTKIMLADECLETNARSPKNYGGSPVSIHLYLKDVDAAVRQAVSAGAKLTRPVEDMFYGDRSGSLEDPYGHTWYIATHIEDVPPAVMRKRAAQLFGNK